MTVAVPATAPRSPIRERWGDALNAGFVVLPVAFARHQKTLGLKDGEMVVLLNLLSAWWYQDQLPFPSTQTMAQRMGTTVRTVQRHLVSLENRGLIRRIRDQPVSARDNALVTKYDLSGFVERMKLHGAFGHPRRQFPATTLEAVDAMQSQGEVTRQS